MGCIGVNKLMETKKDDLTFECCCECGDFACERRFWITVKEYNLASKKGYVRHPACFHNIEKDVELERNEKFAIWG